MTLTRAWRPVDFPSLLACHGSRVRVKYYLCQRPGDPPSWGSEDCRKVGVSSRDSRIRPWKAIIRVYGFGGPPRFIQCVIIGIRHYFYAVDPHLANDICYIVW